MEAVANPLGTKPIRGLIWKFAIPGIITQLVSSVHNIADQVFIGQAMGDLGVAATNVAFPLMTITNAVAALIGMGGAARFSIFLGQKDTEKAARILGNAVSLLLVLGILLSAGASIFLKPLLYLFGATELIMPYASAYSAIISLGIVLGVLSTGLAYFIRADGSPTYSSIVLLSGAIFNIAFDPIFLFGFNMGIRGVALATVLGQLLSTILAVIYLCKRLKCVRLTIKSMLPSWEAIGAIATLGFSAFATHILMTTVQIVQMNALRHYGGLSHYGSETAIAAAGAVGKVSIVFFSGIIGIGQGCQPIYGYNIGSRRYDRVKETFLKALRYTLTIAVCAFVIFQIFPNQIMLLFGSDNPLFYEFAARYMRTYLFMMFLHPLQPIVSMFCTSIGKASLGWMASSAGILLIPFHHLPAALKLTGSSSPPRLDAVASVIFATGFKQIKMLIRLQKEKKRRGGSQKAPWQAAPTAQTKVRHEEGYAAGNTDAARAV